MPQLFPPEILNYSAESYYSKLATHSKIIYLSVLVFIGGILALLPIIKIDISTQSRGVIRTSVENTFIQSSVYGEVIQFGMHENQQVQAGDTLLVFNTERADEQISQEQQKLKENTIFIGDIQLLLAGKSGLQSTKYQSERNRYRSKVNEQKINIDYLNKEYETSKRLYDKKVIAEFEMLQQKNNWEKAKSTLSYVTEDFRTSWQSEQTRLELENQVIESTIRQLEKEKRNYVLTAPSSGTLTQIAGFQQGNFINPNQVIGYISSSDSLLVECYISPSDIGYIKVNQPVIFQMDAFNYREWGMLEGNVSEILNDVINISDRPMFRVRCTLHSSCLHLKNGYEGCAKKGMTLTGRFHLTRRTLWQLLFDKVDNWMNPKIVKE